MFPAWFTISIWPIFCDAAFSDLTAPCCAIFGLLVVVFCLFCLGFFLFCIYIRTIFNQPEPWRVTRSRARLGCAKMARERCREFIVLAVAYNPDPQFPTRLPWWFHLESMWIFLGKGSLHLDIRWYRPVFLLLRLLLFLGGDFGGGRATTSSAWCRGLLWEQQRFEEGSDVSFLFHIPTILFFAHRVY